MKEDLYGQEEKIIRDHRQFGLSLLQLSRKYRLSQVQVQLILNEADKVRRQSKAYKEATERAVEAFDKVIDEYYAPSRKDARDKFVRLLTEPT